MRRPGFLSSKENVAGDMPVTNEDDDVLMENEDRRPTLVLMQCMVESALMLKVFQETFLDHCIGAVVEPNVISLPEPVNY